MRIINPKEVSTAVFHSYLLGAVAPRPIAFASTIDRSGHVNLSPFSFFNAFGSNPPILVFSPSRRVRDNTTKHSLDNVLEHPEVVINIVNFGMVEQTSLASTEYEKGVNEFVKAGFTEAPSVLVKPPRVAEAPAAFECKVLQVLPLGTDGGAANLVICEVVLGHFKEEILDANDQINPFKLDAVARMGGDWYCRAQGEALFKLPKPVHAKAVGVDGIPAAIRNSRVLTGNNLGRLGNVSELPDAEAVHAFRLEPTVAEIFQRFSQHPESLEDHLHDLAKTYLEAGDTDRAWKTLLLSINHPISD